MTEDTRRALEIIRPLAEELGYKVDADTQYLTIGPVQIGIGCNSTYATIMEALGTLFLLEYPSFRRFRLDDDQKECIESCWRKA